MAMLNSQRVISKFEWRINVENMAPVDSKDGSPEGNEDGIQLFPIVCGEPGGAIYRLSQAHDGELTSYN